MGGPKAHLSLPSASLPLLLPRVLSVTACGPDHELDQEELGSWDWKGALLPLYGEDLFQCETYQVTREADFSILGADLHPLGNTGKKINPL